MKTNLPLLRHCSGSVLLVGLAITGILVLSLLSYLSLVQTQHKSVARSQGWNASLALAEAGGEEALAQLNPGTILQVTNLLGGRGWNLNGSFYEPNVNPRSLLGGTYNVRYTADAPPKIYSTGFANIAAISATLKRTIEIITTNAPLFSVGIVARSNINMNGHNVHTDSYNSTQAAHSTTNGQYPSGQTSMIMSNGDIASVYGTVNVDTAVIYGRAGTGPSGSVSWNGSGYISGGTFNDFNMDFPDVQVPFTSGATPTKTGNNWDLTTGNYYVNGNFSLDNNDVLRVSAKAVLYVTGNFSMHSTASIQMTSPTAGLILVVGGANTSFSEVNITGTTANFQYYGLPGNTSISMGSNDRLVGTIYAPNANFTASGGGSDNFDLEGAIVVKTVTMSGHFNLHYDENLRAGTPARGYVAISWKEL